MQHPGVKPFLQHGRFLRIDYKQINIFTMSVLARASHAYCWKVASRSPAIRTEIVPRRLVYEYRHLSSRDTSNARSARSHFKSLPVDSSILKYIENVGVGKISRKRRRRQRQPKSEFLTENQEREQFGHIRRQPSKNPPAPFGQTTEGGTQRLPVKVLGSAGSVEDAIPKATHGLPEVVRTRWSNRKDWLFRLDLMVTLLYTSLGNCRAVECWKIYFIECFALWEWTAEEGRGKRSVFRTETTSAWRNISNREITKGG